MLLHIHTNSSYYQWWLCFILYVTVLGSGSAEPRDKSIFLLAGQSNMAGRGGVINNVWDGLVPPQCEPNPMVLRLDAKHHWVEAKEPLHKDIDIGHSCGVGPGMAFANNVMKVDPRVGVVGLVPCAVGGTNISEWSRGTLLYNQLVRRAFASLRDGGTIQALIWYQGESDTVVKQDAEAYERRLEKLFLDVRSDLQSPMLPIIQVAIGSGEGLYIEEVRQAQMAVDLLNLKTIDAKGLPLEPDNLHLTTPSQVLLGEKLAHAYLQFLPTQTQSNPGNLFVQTNEGNILRIHDCFFLGLVSLLSIFQ